MRRNQQEEALRDWIAQLALLLAQGTSIPRALRALSRWEEASYGLVYQQASAALHQRVVERGVPLSRAMAQLPELFPRLVVGGVYCGEMASNVREATAILADYAYHERHPLVVMDWEATPPAVIALWCRLVGMMFDAGVLVLDIFEAASLVGGAELEEASLALHDWIREGAYVSEALEQQRLFLPVLAEMVRAAEVRNEVGTALRDFALYLQTAAAHRPRSRRPLSRVVRGWRSLWRGVAIPQRWPGREGAQAALPASRRPQPPEVVRSVLRRAIAEGSHHLQLVPDGDALKVRCLVDQIWQTLESFAGVTVSGFLEALQQQTTPLQPGMTEGLRWRHDMDVLEVGWQRRGEDAAAWVEMRVWPESAPVLLSDIGLLGSSETILRRLHQAPPGLLVVAAPTQQGRSTSTLAFLYELLPRGPDRLVISEPGQGSLPASQRVVVEEGDFGAALAMSAAYRPQTVALQSMDAPTLWPMLLDLVRAGSFVVAALTSAEDAVGVLQRLRAGMPDQSELAECLFGVVAQRVVRRPCVECRKEYRPSVEKLRAFGLVRERLGDSHLYLANQCEHCRATGYRGQAGLFEVLLADELVRRWLRSANSDQSLREHLSSAGHRFLLDDGVRLLGLGWTTLEELDRALMLRQR